MRPAATNIQESIPLGALGFPLLRTTLPASCPVVSMVLMELFSAAMRSAYSCTCCAEYARGSVSLAARRAAVFSAAVAEASCFCSAATWLSVTCLAFAARNARNAVA